MNDQPSHSAILLCNIAKPIHLLNTRLNSFHFGCWTCLHHLGILKPIPDRPAEQSWFGLGSDGLRDDFVRIWIQGDSPLKIYHHGKVLSQMAWSLVICDRQDALYILFSIEIEGCIQYSDCISWYCLYSFGFSSRLDDVDDWMFVHCDIQPSVMNCQRIWGEGRTCVVEVMTHLSDWIESLASIDVHKLQTWV